MQQGSHRAETSLAPTVTVCCPNWTNGTQGSRLLSFSKTSSPSYFLLHKILSGIVGQEAKDESPKTERNWSEGKLKCLKSGQRRSFLGTDVS